MRERERKNPQAGPLSFVVIVELLPECLSPPRENGNSPRVENGKLTVFLSELTKTKNNGITQKTQNKFSLKRTQLENLYLEKPEASPAHF